MNSFFCSVGKDLADKIDSSPNPLLSGDYEVKKIRQNFALRQLRSKGSGMYLPQSKQQRALGLTTALATFLKLALPFIGNSLAVLFNTSIETGQFPDSWKVARVTQIFKDGEKTNKSSYRPISVLPVGSDL